MKDVYVLGEGASSDIGIAIAPLVSINNPLSNQIFMNAERPKFKGTAENYAEIKRGWNEYHRIIEANSLGTNEGQILHFFRTCLDEGTALQLKREIEANPRITVAQYLNFMENDFGKDFSGQSN